ncbi:MAG: ParB/RepB/Spo0J family partition protein [Candidatus Bathyarchaeia archaeon]
MIEVPLNALKSPLWLLRPLDRQVVSELARSIQTSGLLQPIVVRKDHGRYEVVFGNHRVEACRRLGMSSIAAILVQLQDDEVFLARLSENLLRNCYVNPIEEAEGYKMLVARGWSINSIASRVGKCDSYVCERIGLLDRLNPNIRSKIANGTRHLTASHAELISRIKDRNRQDAVARFVEKKRLSVRALENLLKCSPAPTIVRAESAFQDGLLVRIPDEFAKAIEINVSQSLYMYVRGKKLILEAEATRIRRPRKSVCPPSYAMSGMHFPAFNERNSHVRTVPELTR